LKQKIAAFNGLSRSRPGAVLGISLIEVAVAILVISIGALGLAAMQLSAKRAGFEAVQRTNASGLAMDILERMRANPGVLDDYAVASLDGDDLSTPANTCNATCTEAEVATLDLWEWEQALAGAAETRGGNAVGGLLNPTGCITVNDGEVRVAIAWQGFETLSNSPVDRSDCGSGTGKYDGDGGEPDAKRQLLVVDTFITDG
jgi:type IV pilus assembly protein PilV